MAKVKFVKSTVNASTQRVVNQLSALSASRKQPKILKLSQEDLIKHKTIENAWSVYNSRRDRIREQQLQKQYKLIENAMTKLKELSPTLFQMTKVKKDYYPLDMRVPTDYPANEPWVYNYKS